MDIAATTFDQAEAERLDRLWATAEAEDEKAFPRSVIYRAPHLALADDARKVSRVMFRVVAELRPRGLPLWWVREKFQAMGLPTLIAEHLERHFATHRLCRLIDGEFRVVVEQGAWTRLSTEKVS